MEKGTVLISGSTGFIGRRLVQCLLEEHFPVRELSRYPHGSGRYYWDPETDQMDADALDNVEAVIHLAGENIASGRWTRSRKERIRNSRVNGTRYL